MLMPRHQAHDGSIELVERRCGDIAHVNIGAQYAHTAVDPGIYGARHQGVFGHDHCAGGGWVAALAVDIRQASHMVCEAWNVGKTFQLGKRCRIWQQIWGHKKPDGHATVLWHHFYRRKHGCTCFHIPYCCTVGANAAGRGMTCSPSSFPMSTLAARCAPSKGGMLAGLGILSSVKSCINSWASRSGARWSGSNIRIRRCCEKIWLRIRCSALGPERGMTRAFLRNASTSQRLLYPAMVTTAAACRRRRVASSELLRISTGQAAAWAMRSARSAGDMWGPVRIKARSRMCCRRNGNAFRKVWATGKAVFPTTSHDQNKWRI